MGMAASQVRFLTLQDRKSTIGMRLGVLSNRKMALTRDMNKAAQAYNEAYSETKLQWYDSIDGKYTDITYAAMMTPNAGNSYTPFILTERNSGKVVLDGLTNVGTICNSPSIGTNMVHGMELIVEAGGYTPATYKAGLLAYDETSMAPIIIKDIMGITDFDANKMIYEGVKNKEITAGGYQHIVRSDFMSQLTETISQQARSSTTALVPVWEFVNKTGQDKYSFHRALDMLTGEYIDVSLDEGGHYHDNDWGDTMPAWFKAILNGITGGTWSLVENIQAATSDYEFDTLQDLYDANNKAAYLDASGNAHELSENIYWSTLYNNGAVVFIKGTVSADWDTRTATQNDEGEYNSHDTRTSVKYQDAQSKIDNITSSGALYKWAYSFAESVNNSGLLEYNMDNYLGFIASATTRTLRDAWNADYDWVAQKDRGYASADTYLENQAILSSDSVEDKNYIRFQDWENHDIEDAVEYSVYASNGHSPVGEGVENGSDNILVAVAKEANGTISPIITEAAHFYWHNDKPQDYTPGYGADNSAAFSVKNMMDVALYYIDIVQEKLSENNESAINSDSKLYDFAKHDFDYPNYENGNFSASTSYNYTDPLNFSEGDIKVFQQGETRVASVRSILSNLEMLKEKVDHCSNNLDININNIGYYNDEDSYGGTYGHLKNILRDIIENNTQITSQDLMLFANINEWICKALEQDYSTEGGVNQLNEYISNAWNALTLYWNGHFSEGRWDSGQAGDYKSGYAYDGPNAVEGNTGTTTWNRREQLFSQDSIDRKATKKLDIEGQLTALQLHQFKFYVNLVKECLARGWSNHNTSTTSLDNNSVSLHLQNGTWLINDTMAKSSSRVFEVANKEAREEALSKYEALQSELKVKEERIDIQMEKLETEQNAIKTELDSLKSIIKENIDSTFKIFNA